MGSLDSITYAEQELALPAKALGAVLLGPYGEPYTFQDVPVVPPSKDEVLVRLLYTGVCHGDIYARDGGGPAPVKANRPLIGGHEGVGRIVAMGAEGAIGFKTGDVVGIGWRSYVCGNCKPCLEGAENFCYNQKVTGSHRDGTFQRYLSYPASQLVHVPETIPLPSICPILCAGVTAYTSLRAMQPQSGRWCVVVGGAGGLGHLAIQYAKSMGLKVLAIDSSAPEKREFCMQMGSDVFLDFTQDTLIEDVRRETDGGADYILVFSPHQSSYDAAGEYAGFGAQIMAVGIGNASMPLRPILQKNLLVRSNVTGTLADIRAALDVCAQGKVVPRIEIIDLKALNTTLDAMKTGTLLGRVVVDLSL